ncbi:hypothetical protein JHK86_014472 [Glycine max]|nr:hypothetical protein JHK86_014472 [Glycine max]
MVIQYLMWDVVGGSLALYIAKKYTNCRVTGICNSTTQKAYIDEKCWDLQLQNLNIIVPDISTFEMEASITEYFPEKCLRYGKDSATKWTAYWRTFFITVAELFGYNNGEEWIVAHFLFKKK